MSVFMITVVRSGFIVRYRFYALVGLLSLRQFPVHWERNENKHAISKAYRMGNFALLAATVLIVGGIALGLSDPIVRLYRL
jgi:hypothetical protein